MRLFGPAEIIAEDEIVSVNGAGDTFLGVLVAGLAHGTLPYDRLVDIAQQAAVMTLKSSDSVHPDISMLRDSLM